MNQQNFRIRVLASLLLTVSATAVAGESPDASERGLGLYRDLPRDPVLVLGIRAEDPPEEFAGLMDFVSRLQGSAGIEHAADLLGRMDHRLLSTLQRELLPHVGPEITASVDFPPIDEMVAAVQYAAEGLSEKILGRVGVVAQVRNREALDEGLRRMLVEAGGQVAEFEGVVRTDLPLEWKGRQVDGSGTSPRILRIYHALRDDRLAVGFTREWVIAALDRPGDGGRLIDGQDFATVFARLDAAPSDLVYVNLPKILDYVRGSGIVQMVLQASPEARTLVNRFFTVETMSVGLGSTSVVEGGGVKTTHFGPPWMSGLAASSGLVAALAVPNLLAGVDRGKSRRTLADIEAIATACEGFSSDSKIYPGPTDEWVPVERIAGFLEPVYIRELPRNDAWQNPILYWSNGESYRIISTGRDGRMDHDWSGLFEPMTSVGIRGDIVFGDGKLLVAPIHLPD